MFKQRKFFRRILIFQTIVSLVYILVFSFVSYSQNKLMIEQKFAQESRHVITQTFNTFNKNLSVTSSIINSITVSGMLQEYAIKGDDDFYTAYQMMSALGAYSTQLNYFRAEVGFGTYSGNRLVSNIGTYSLDQFISNNGFKSMSAKDIFTELEKFKYFSLNGPYKTAIFQRLVPIPGKVCYSVTIFSKNGLDIFLNQYDNYGFYICDGDKPVLDLSTSDRIDIDTAMKAVKAGEKTLMSEYQIYSGIDDGSGWSYIFAISDKAIKHSLLLTFIKTILILGLLEVVGLFLIYLSAKRIYQPINHMMQMLFRVGNEGIKDEISYFLESYQKISYRSAEQEQTINTAVSYARPKIMMDLLSGVASLESVQSTLRGCDLSIFDGEITLVHIAIRYYGKHMTSDLLADIREHLIKLLKTAFSSQGVMCEIFPIEIDRLMVIYRGLPEGAAEIVRNVSGLADKELETVLTCIISGRVNGISQAGESYRRILFASQTLVTNNIVNMLDDIRNDTLPDFYYPIDMERRIIADMISGNAESAINTLDGIFQVNISQEEFDAANLALFKSLMLGSVMRVLQVIKCHYDDHLLSLMGQIKKAYNAEALRNAMFEAVRLISSGIKNKVNEEDKKIVAEIEAFIQENYDKDISLSELACSHNISQSYLSILFRKYTGYTFKDYLNGSKIEKAAQILRQDPSIKISDLSSCLGFNSANTFIKVFKSYKGVSPGQYAGKHK